MDTETKDDHGDTALMNAASCSHSHAHLLLQFETGEEDHNRDADA